MNAAYLGITLTTHLDDEFGFRIWPATSADPFAVVNIFVAVLTLVLVKPMIIVDFCRQDAFTSMIMTELGVLCTLNIFWVVAAGYTTNTFTSISAWCTENSNIKAVSAACTDAQVSLAFSWLNCIMLMAYGGTLLTYAIIYGNKGAPIWTKSVRFASMSPAQPASHAKSADYYQSAPAVPQTAPPRQETSPPPPVRIQSMSQQAQLQPQMQTYGGTLYRPPPTGMVHGESPLRAEV